MIYTEGVREKLSPFMLNTMFGNRFVLLQLTAACAEMQHVNDLYAGWWNEYISAH